MSPVRHETRATNWPRLTYTSDISRGLNFCPRFSEHDDGPDKPGGPPNTPDDDRDVQAPDVPAKGGFAEDVLEGLQQGTSTRPVMGVRRDPGEHYGRRTKDVKQGCIGVPHSRIAGPGASEGEGGGDQAHREGETEVQRGEGAEEHTEEEEGEAFEDV